MKECFHHSTILHRIQWCHPWQLSFGQQLRQNEDTFSSHCRVHLDCGHVCIGAETVFRFLGSGLYFTKSISKNKSNLFPIPLLFFPLSFCSCWSPIAQTHSAFQLLFIHQYKKGAAFRHHDQTIVLRPNNCFETLIGDLGSEKHVLEHQFISFLKKSFS